MASIGRPSKFDKAVTDRICDAVATSTLSLEAICNNDDLLPDSRTVWRWLNDEDPAKDAFRRAYARAKSQQADILAQEMLSIADDGSRDVRITDEGHEVVDHDHIARSRLRVDTRKWLASRLAPRKYGERIEHAGDPDAPMKHEIAVASPEDIARAMLAVVARSEAARSEGGA